MTYINIHTHQVQPEGIIAVNNILLQDYYSVSEERKELFSAGVHPWHVMQLKDRTHELLALLEQVARQPGLVAIGETGLDKAIEAPLELQKQFFGVQAHLAERLQKPMIIHCVKAFQELIAFRKENHFAAPWVIHGFKGSKELARQLVDEGFYLSFGPSLMKDHKKTLESLQSVNLSRIFLETDDEKVAIEEIYKNAARQLDVSVSLLQQIIVESFNKLFKKY